MLASNAGNDRFFVPGDRLGHWQFDLPGYCASRLGFMPDVGVLDVDTRTDEARFWSHRRRTLAARDSGMPGGGPAPIGHQISVIVG